MIRLAALLHFAIALPGAAELAGQEWNVDLGAERSVRFVSETSIESFEGRSDRVDGFVWLGEGVRADALAVGASFPDGRLYFEADLAALDTGIGLRDRHMREDYLDTDRFPFATFDGRIGAVSDAGEGRLRITAPGTFTVHGVERTRTISCIVEPAGDRLGVGCGFPVRLADHEIEVPQVMFLKLAEEVQVEVAFTLRAVDSGDHP